MVVVVRVSWFEVVLFRCSVLVCLFVCSYFVVDTTSREWAWQIHSNSRLVRLVIAPFILYVVRVFCVFGTLCDRIPILWL